MSENTSREVRLKTRPVGLPKESDFELAEVTVGAPGEDEVLIRNLYMSVDPYMRGRMSAAKSYAASVEEGSVMEGATVGQVVESRSGDFKQGDYVLCPGGWQEYSVNSPKAMRKLDPAQAPISTAVGVLGMPGFTAYVGLDEIGKPQKGETVVVSAAAGAVGQVVGQIAKLKGCRVVGVAGAEDKCKHVVGAYGFDACVNYKDADFREQLAKACPDGIDVYFENVGGETFDAVMELVNDFARIPVCGRIAHYNDTAMPEGPDRLPGFMGKVLVKRLLIKGFIQFDYIHRQGDFLKDMPVWIREGKVKYQEDVVEGLENAVSAFQGLLQGKNRGKLLIQVGDDPTKK